MFKVLTILETLKSQLIQIWQSINMILTFLWKKNLDEDDDEESKKEQVAMDGDAFSTRNPTNKIPEPSLAESMALLREAIKLHTTQN